MNKITTIIPVHEYNDIVEQYLHDAINSVLDQEDGIYSQIVIISSEEINEAIKVKLAYLNDKIKYINNPGDLSYQNQINYAAYQISTDYFMVLEFDDTISKTYYKNLNKHIESFSETDIFLSMMIEVNSRNEGIKITNEVLWSQQLIGENGTVGYLNIDILKQFSDFKLSGAVINRKSFLSIGGYKTKIKLTFMYEFLLRAINNGLKIYSVPKIGYKHINDRENSMFDLYAKNMEMSERKFWFDTALIEYNFINDRDINLS